MVILHIASLDGYEFSGVNVVVPQHIKAQRELGHEAALFNTRGIKLDNVDLQFEDLRKFELSTLPAPFNKPDLVIFHECYHREYLTIWKTLKKSGIPYVIIPHGELREEAQRKKHLKKAVANFLLFNAFINNSKALQLLSNSEKDRTYFGKKKFIGTNGVNVPGRTKDSFNDSVLKIVYIGRLEWHIKGLDLLINAAAMIKDEFKEKQVQIDIYGPDVKGRYAQVEKLLRDAGAEEVVTLHREVTGSEKEDILLDSDIFIQTSRNEGMPLGILEALSYGLPCIATVGTTFGDEIESKKAGWKAENSAESIAEAIKRAMAEREHYREYSRNACEMIKEKYSWPRVMARTVEEYKKLIEE